MEPGEGSFLRFCCFVRSFQCERVPCDLLVRACEAKPTWSSSGEVVEKLPLEAGVPEWLVDFYDTNKSLFHNPDIGARIGCMELIVENGVPYFEVAKARQPELELYQLLSIADERSMAQERITVVLQAFPSINIEIIGEEIVDRLMDIATRSVLPLLSCVTDADIKDWLLPNNHRELESHVFSLLEFLYQVIAILGIEHPLLPLSLPERILSIVPHGTGNDCIAYLQKMADIWNRSPYNGQNALQCNFLSSEARADERSHAMLGYLLSLQDGHFAEALSTWQPLLSNRPSKMEYLAAISFCDQSRLSLIGKPAFLTFDTWVLEGLLRSRRKQHDQAAKVLEATRVELMSRYRPCSMQVGIVIAELANCYNILRREALAEITLTPTLEVRLASNLSNRRDGIYLRLALADSFIGQARYQDAVPVLESVIDKPNISATFRMMSALRLARSRRRMHDNAQKAFEPNSPLWTGLSLLGSVPEVLVMEYFEELGCSISEIPNRQMDSSRNTQELIEAVNSVLCTSSSLSDKPCWEWYAKCQQEFLGQITKATKTNKGKEREEVLQNEDLHRMGTPISPQTSPCLPPRVDDHKSDDEGPWSERLVLSFDGGGVRAISSLLILKRIMHQIMVLELTHPDGPSYSCGSVPWTEDESGVPELPKESDRVDGFLPCHYFDYMAGTSTGGLNSIMLGRVRMTVDRAIDNFIDFGNSVFGHLQLFHVTSAYFRPRAKYSAVKACEAFKKIVTSRFPSTLSEALSLVSLCPWATFVMDGGCTKTMAISYRVDDNVEKAHIWRSYDYPDSNTCLDRSAEIWEVAMATSATPGYFSPIKINGATYIDGSLVANNPSYRALREVSSIHSKAPVVFVNIGTGRQVGTNVIFRSDAKWRDRPWSERLQHPNRLFQYTTTEFYAETETKEWLELAERMGLEKAYRLSVEGDLQTIPYDDWRPAGTGKKTLQKITDFTEEYLRKDEVRDIINSIAHEAVRIRRARAITGRWEAFAKGYASDSEWINADR
ncbi:acyl transferase/acyl hydrolase/lysophospholipase [Fusarium oxysporum Fo47]|uniref:PNPLA domain-containing protein n=2 Tax=Fusarium oxysporum TaxID=5507 RepID=A0A3L6P4E2_FUSOX|nr:acyl transferase/acyl hydrolase/lysophospholipase [Fusarium oxysporum Fo47]EWZ52500.1 hypothetical protein FOZG_02266 [Fusarium oxysporum Fo47]QKD46517.1 acyl transferase/acyl hydrolase/lysophospholipase [Fusarium oxysporum Fo47]RKK28758.1 hypothetical protein BFJ65_g700 [Fusarium oxysporum f. sp. cepae]